MELDTFLRGVEIGARWGPLPAQVSGVHYDSRRVQPGWAFVAIRGEQTDGNAFIAQARARGASLVLSEAPASGESGGHVQVANARRALAQTAANWFQRPAERLRLIGITGTNGKTSTAFLVEGLLRAAGWRSGLLGTIEYHIGQTVLASPHTTPESYDLQSLLAEMTAAGCAAAVMEVSSHALAMERVWGCHFEAAVYTNLTQDHLDFHHTLEAYRAAKRRLFEGTGAGAPDAAVVNHDDAAAAEMVRGYGGRVLTYGLNPGAELRASDLEATPAGLSFKLQGAGAPRAVQSPLLGRVNALNLLAALGTGLVLGLEMEAMIAAVAELPRVRGRFERVYAGQPFTVVVDYAHTPDALVHVLELARELTRNRVLVVFGCGGDRDRSKRPLMGAAAAAGADWVMITSDNPRSEDPERIIAETAAGAPRAQREPERRRAIGAALEAARAGDVVVIAGKGHETYQIVGSERRPFDDVAVAQAELEKLGYRK